MSDDLVARLRKYAQWLTRRRHEVGVALTTDAADCIEELTAECRDLTTRAEAAEEAHSEALAERDTLAEMVREAELAVELDATGHPLLTASGYAISGLTTDQAERFRALLVPEDGGESPVFASAQPMSPTMRQAVAEAKQRPPARHFEPSTLLEDGETEEDL